MGPLRNLGYPVPKVIPIDQASHIVRGDAGKYRVFAWLVCLILTKWYLQGFFIISQSNQPSNIRSRPYSYWVVFGLRPSGQVRANLPQWTKHALLTDDDGQHIIERTLPGSVAKNLPQAVWPKLVHERDPKHHCLGFYLHTTISGGAILGLGMTILSTNSNFFLK
jgi:hypothetical protein